MKQMTAEQAAEAAKGLTFEKVWAALMESRQRMEESYLETQRSLSELDDKLDKSLGRLGNSLGQLTEAMFSAELWKKFSDIGFPFSRQSERVKFTKNKQIIAEVDLFLENGEYAMLVEIKANLSEENVNDHLERIAIVREYLNTKGDSRKIVGAVAGGIVQENVLRYAQKKGLYVVVQSGEASTIANMPQDFRAREWVFHKHNGTGLF